MLVLCYQSYIRLTFFLRGEELDLATEFKYLGVICDSSLTFKKQLKRFKKRSSSTYCPQLQTH